MIWFISILILVALRLLQNKYWYENLLISVQSIFPQELYNQYLIEREKKKNKFFEKPFEYSLVDNKPSVTSSVKFTSKVWCHRVNTPEKLKYILTKFSGIELDVVFEDSLEIFDIRHPPTSYRGFSLTDYLSIIQKSKNRIQLWLDFKNLNSGNLKLALNRINKLDSIFQLKDRVIIESGNPKVLKIFRHNGYFTSYYLPDLKSMPDEKLRKEVTKISTYLNTGEISAISQGLDNYEYMQYFFPKTPKLTWGFQLHQNEFYKYKELQEVISQDSTLQVILINYGY